MIGPSAPHPPLRSFGDCTPEVEGHAVSPDDQTEIAVFDQQWL